MRAVKQERCGSKLELMTNLKSKEIDRMGMNQVEYTLDAALLF